jgi:mannose-6-phosphate isomerase-like protein (cupin superfamily)
VNEPLESGLEPSFAWRVDGTEIQDYQLLRSEVRAMRRVARADELESIDLPAGAAGGIIRYFRGEAYDVELSLLRVEINAGQGAPPHTHTYDELFVIHEGRGRYTVGDETVEAGAGDVVVVPAGLPHGFVSLGPGPLKQTSVHRSPVFEQTLVDKPD